MYVRPSFATHTEAAAHDRGGRREVVCGVYVPVEATSQVKQLESFAMHKSPLTCVHRSMGCVSRWNTEHRCYCCCCCCCCVHRYCLLTQWNDSANNVRPLQHCNASSAVNTVDIPVQTTHSPLDSQLQHGPIVQQCLRSHDLTAR